MTETQKPRVLFLAHLLPYPLDGGAKIKSYYTLRKLAEAYEVTLLAFVRSEDEKRHTAPLRDLCAGGIETVLIRRSRIKNVWDAARLLLLRRSFIVGRDQVGAMARAVRARLGGGRYGVVHIDHLQMAQYVLPRRTAAELILDHHNVESQIIERMADTTQSRAMRWYANKEWPKLQRYELEVCRAVDQVLTVSAEDARTLHRLAPDLKNLTPVPIGVDGDYFRPVPRSSESRTLLSIGTMDWPPNVESLLWFYGSVYPQIRAAVPDVKLNIVGADPVDKIRRLAREDKSVSVSGYVQDVRPTAADCAAFIVPLRSGSGMRVKILNAMAMALPVVSTTVGVEGIAATHRKDILVADTPDEFARECIRLLRDPERGTEIGAAARKLVEEHYSWEAIGKELLAVYDHVLQQPSRPPAGVKVAR
ncbi:MAG: glycosyltransferase [Armatimonadetes bacterium]|nr:glycosyltransferase [Armatimonadota bacterium]